MMIGSVAIARSEPVSPRAVDALFAEYERPGSPGLALGISRGGEVLYRRGYGLANLEHPAPITPQTVFHVASVSKQFTALAVALLARDGKLRLDDEVRTHLPYVPDFGTPITLNHLIHHTSGLRDQWPLFDLGGQDGVRRQQQIVQMVSRQQALNFPPGSDYTYSNTGYTLLAEVVAKVSGRTFREFTNERIFAPLGMSHSFFYDDAREVVPSRAESYVPSEPGKWQRAPLNYETVGATSLHTTVDDMLRYVANFSRPVIGDNNLQELLRAPGTLNDGSTVNYGFGLTTRNYAGHKAVLHTGADAGYVAVVAYIPAQDFAVVIMMNTPSDLHVFVEKIVNLYLNDGAPLQPPQLPRASKPSLKSLTTIAGQYVLGADRLVTLELKDGALLWKTLTIAGEPVVFRKDGSFDLNEREWNYYRLRRDPRGNVLGFDSIDTRGQETTKFFRRLASSETPRATFDELSTLR